MAPWVVLATTTLLLASLLLPSPALLFLTRVGAALLALDFLFRLLTQPLGPYFRHGAGWVHLLAALPGLFLPLLFLPGLSDLLRWFPLFVLFRLPWWMDRVAGWRLSPSPDPWVRRRLRLAGVALLAATLVLLGTTHVLVRSYHLETVRENLDLHERLTGSFNLAVQLLPPADVVAWQQGGNFTRPLDDVLTAREYLLLQRRTTFLTVKLDEQRSVILHDHRLATLEGRWFFLVLSLGLLGLGALSGGMGRSLYRDRNRLARIHEALTTRNPGSLADEPDADPAAIPENLARATREVLTTPGKRGGHAGHSIPAAPPLNESLVQFRKELLEDLQASQTETAKTAVRLSAKSILDYLKKHGYGT